MKKWVRLTAISFPTFLVSGVAAYLITTVPVKPVDDHLTPAQRSFNKLIDNMQNMKTIDGSLSLSVSTPNATFSYDNASLKVDINPENISFETKGDITFEKEKFDFTFSHTNGINYVDFNDKTLQFTFDDLDTILEDLEAEQIHIKKIINMIIDALPEFNMTKFMDKLTFIEASDKFTFSSENYENVSLICDTTYNLSGAKVKVKNEPQLDFLAEFMCDTDHQKAIDPITPKEDYQKLIDFREAIKKIANNLSKGDAKGLIKKLLNIFEKERVVNSNITNFPLGDYSDYTGEYEEGHIDVNLKSENGQLNIKRIVTVDEEEIKDKGLTKTISFEDFALSPIDIIFSDMFMFQKKYVDELKKLDLPPLTPEILQAIADNVSLVPNEEKTKWDLGMKNEDESYIEYTIGLSFKDTKGDDYIDAIDGKISISLHLILTEIDFINCDIAIEII